MDQLISACGLLCSDCQFYDKTCRGCFTVKGLTFWAADSMPDKMCPLYRCSVVERGYADCGQCSEIPCKKFTDLKDPNISEEQHIRSIHERVERLKQRSK